MVAGGVGMGLNGKGRVKHPMLYVFMVVLACSDVLPSALLRERSCSMRKQAVRCYIQQSPCPFPPLFLMPFTMLFFATHTWSLPTSPLPPPDNGAFRVMACQAQPH